MAKPKVKPKPFTPARVKKLAKNPGTRSTIPTRLLPQQYRGEREKNARLNSPVAPGSALTNRQLGRDTKSYMTQKYGQGDVVERQGIATQEGINRDTTGWYQQYLQDLRTHAANVNTFADQNVQQTQAAGTGIANAAGQALAGQRDPISQGINAQAADTRARYAGSFAGQASAVGTANKTYASTVANVVGPGQKLQAQVQGTRALTTLKEKQTARADAKGADAALYRSGRISEEQKIAAAEAIAQGKSVTDITEATIRSKTATDVAKINAGSKTPPVPYYTWAQWKSMTPAQKREAVRQYNKDTTKPGKPKAPAKPKADKPGTDSRDPQKRFDAAYSTLGGLTDAAGKPYTAATIRRDAKKLVAQMVDAGLSRKLALRVLSAYVKNNGGNPGSFKNYGKPGSPAIPGN